MFNVAICDDNIQFCVELNQHLCRKFNGHINKIFCYTNGMQLINDIKEFNMTFDVLFLDIDMPGLSGVDTANELRKLTNYSDAVIFFVTSYDISAKEIVDIHPFAYISKPIEYNKFDSKFNKVIHMFFESNKLISFSKKNTHLVLDYRRIIYISSENRGSTFYLDRGTSNINMSISEIEEVLISHPMFARIHSSHIINLKYLEKVTPKCIELNNGKLLPISRKFKDNFLLKLANNLYP